MSRAALDVLVCFVCPQLRKCCQERLSPLITLQSCGATLEIDVIAIVAFPLGSGFSWARELESDWGCGENAGPDIVTECDGFCLPNCLRAVFSAPEFSVYVEWAPATDTETVDVMTHVPPQKKRKDTA